MPPLGRAGRQLRSWLFKATVKEEVDAELEFHLAMRVRELTRRGFSADDARRRALERMGDLRRMKLQLQSIGAGRERDARLAEWWGDVTGDASFAVRQLRRSPGFAIVAAFTLALGIGATTSVFSLLHAIVLKPLPFHAPERVMSLSEAYQGRPGGNMSAPAFVAWRDATKSMSHMAAEEYWSFNLADATQPERVFGGRVTHAFFGVFGVPPMLGRTFSATDDQAGSDRVAVLSHGLWQQRFGGDTAAVGREIRLDGALYTVIGVMPGSFDYVENGERLWVPLVFTPQRLAHPDEHYLDVVGRLRDGATIEQAIAEAVPVARGLHERAPLEYDERDLAVTSLSEVVGGPYRSRLLLLLGCVAFVMLIACANVANLLLARGAGRAKEMAIRGAMGAGRRRLVRQLLTESGILAVAGAALGCGLAVFGVRALVALAPGAVPRIGDAQINGEALAFALGISLLCTLLFGLLPALRASRFDLQATLRDGGRGSAQVVRDRVRAMLITGEVALALVLLTGAGLLVRTAIAMQRVDTGFDPAQVITARVTLPRDVYQWRERIEPFFTRVVETLRATPGIRAATVSSQSPLGAGGSGNGLVDAEKPIDSKFFVDARSRFVDPQHFRTLGIRLLEGRDFTDRDIRGAPRVMILSKRAATVMFLGQSALGKRLGCCEGSPADPAWKEVVGVVADVTADSLLSRDARPVFYIPTAQVPDVAWEWIQRTMTIIVRHAGSEETAVAALRSAVREADPTIPLFDVATMNTRFRRAFAQSRFNTMLLGTLGLAGLILAAVGIYGVIGYFVGQRTQEIGVRMALGASARDVIALVSWQGMRPVIWGIVLGLGLSLMTTRLLSSVLYGVTPNDPLTMAGVVAILTLVALGAALIPARRASRVHPTEALAG
ncbi:MAG: ADOP family duplicated permease [Gemmatimonadaceae bacterium]